MTQISPATGGAARAVNVSTPVQPTKVGTWEIVRRVGQGQLASVYQARPCGGSGDSPASYAVKVLEPRWQDDPRAAEMLHREAHIGQKISHPHLVPILAVGLLDKPRHVVMPLLEGTTVAERISGGSRLAVAQSLWIARQVAEALGALASAGWMHADIKPSNIFISPRGHVTLIDLGFARRVSEMAVLVDRPVIGTLNYISPELLTARLAADVRSDIFSLGVTLYQMLAGRLPFAAADLAGLVALHRAGQIADLRAQRPQLPAEIAQLVREMLAREPLRRPQSPTELVERLTTFEIDNFADRDAA